MTNASTLSDADIGRAVMRELERDSRVECKAIVVSVKDAVVTLEGFVYSYANKLAAREVAHRVDGVLKVTDEIRLSGGLLV